MSALTFFDWLWIAFVVAICLCAVLRTWQDRKESKRELKDAETFQQQIDEIKHKDYGKEKETVFEVVLQMAESKSTYRHSWS